jgi:hypothetical protein
VFAVVSDGRRTPDKMRVVGGSVGFGARLRSKINCLLFGIG